jgi:alcohol dehydrogenase
MTLSVPQPRHVPQAVAGSTVPLLFARGALEDLGREAAKLGTRVLLVSDPGIAKAGHVAHAEANLKRAGLQVAVFAGAGENPTTDHIAAGLEVARAGNINLIVGLGGGSSMDCAKGINFLISNGGRMQDYWGVGKATKPMLPLIAIPTTTGTGSEAQSAALITDPATHQKMACLDKKTLASLAILDVTLTDTQPPRVAALTGIDAISHAIETAACNKRTAVSRELSAAAWGLLSGSYKTMLADPPDAAARQNMLLGAHLAGCAIENAMLGAAHACANPLTAAFGLPHGAAVGLMLPAVIRFNAAANNPYSDLGDAETLALQVDEFLRAAGLPRTLTSVEIPKSRLPELARNAATQWTATFNPIPVGEAELLRIYESVFE